MEISDAVFKRLLRSRSPDDLHHSVLREIDYRLPADGCAFALSTETGLEIVATSGELVDETTLSDMASSFSLLSLVYQNDQSLRIGDLTDTRGTSASDSPSAQSPRLADSPAGPSSVQSSRPSDVPRALLCAPVAGVGVVVAVSRSAGAFSETDLEWLTQLTEYTAASYERFGDGHASSTSEFERIQNARNRMQYALNVTDSYIWAVDLDTDEVTTLVGPIERLFGSLPQEIDDIWDVFNMLVHPDEHSDAEDLYEQLRTGDVDEFEMTHRTPASSQDVEWLRVSGQVQSEDGSRHLIGLATDVTEQKQREKELEIQNERLERLMSVVSHDLRNPLSVATGRLELATDECESDHLEDVQHALDRMQTLIADLLSLAKEGEPVTEPDAIRLPDVVESCWRNVQTEPATLAVETEQTLLADRSRLALFCRRVTTVSGTLTAFFRQINPELDAVWRYGIAQTAGVDVSRPCQTAR